MQAQRQDLLEDFLEEVTMKVISLIKQFQTAPRYVRITGMQPEQIAEAFPGLQMDETGIYFLIRDDGGSGPLHVLPAGIRRARFAREAVGGRAFAVVMLDRGVAATVARLFALGDAAGGVCVAGWRGGRDAGRGR